MQLIPAIDLIEGRCVRLFKGDYAAVTHYDVAPADLLASYARHGAQWVHVVDLDGARDGVRVNQQLIAALAAGSPPRLQVGGGLRDVRAIEATLQSGVARVVLGSAALTHPAAVSDWFIQFGAQRIVLALDIRHDDLGIPRVASHGWQRQSSAALWDVVESFLPHGLIHVLCTDVGRDGALSGPNLDLYREAHTRYPQCHWQASGGIRDADDLRAVASTGVAAAISGKALLEKRITFEEIAAFSPNV